MKKLTTKLLLASFLFSSVAQAQMQNVDIDTLAKDLGGNCTLSHKQVTKVDSDRYSENVSDFLNNDRYGSEWTCVMLKRHLKRDTMKNCTPALASLDALSLSKQVLIKGKIKYLGMVPQDYAYDMVTNSDGKQDITVRIHFNGELGNDQDAINKTKEKLAFASELWSKNSPNQSMQFQFLAVAANENPHFTVKLISKDTNVKYNSHWSIHDSTTIVSHEVGHMLGLDDEYSLIRSQIWQVKNEVDSNQCNLRGIMCDTYNLKPTIYPYYYYIIARRGICTND